jgi:hypothetical protein
MRRDLRIFLLLTLLAAPALAWEVSADAPESAFRDFHRRFSAAAYNYPRHGAAPLGLIGFEIYADAAVDRSFDDEPFVDTAIDGDMTGGFLSVARVGARKGLPGGIDIGLSYGRALGGDIKLVSGEIQYAILKGGLVQPALSVRVTGTRTLDTKAYDLDQYGAELLLSKGFTVVTPYVGAGVIRSKGRLDSTLGNTFEDTHNRGVVFGGVRLNLLLPKIVIEVEKAEVVQGAVRVGFGL